MYTSYFARIGFIKDQSKIISIARSAPKFYKGESFLALAPTSSLLWAWKQGKLTEQEYEDIYYRDVLSKLDPRKTYELLKDKILTCWENPTGFCHRHIIAKWFFETLGIVVLELKAEEATKI